MNTVRNVFLLNFSIRTRDVLCLKRSISTMPRSCLSSSGVLKVTVATFESFSQRKHCWLLVNGYSITERFLHTISEDLVQPVECFDLRTVSRCAEPTNKAALFFSVLLHSTFINVETNVQAAKHQYMYARPFRYHSCKVISVKLPLYNQSLLIGQTLVLLNNPALD